MSQSVEQRIFEIEHLITAAAKASGRERSDVNVVAVSKTWPADVVRHAHALGLRSFGENYVQEAQEKMLLLKDLEIDWHFVGQLQSNKVKSIVNQFSLIHSLDRLKIANEISERTLNDTNAVSQSVLIEVNIGEEQTKHGVKISEVGRLLDQVQSLSAITIRGLMIMPPPTWSKEELKKAFAQVRDERDRLQSRVSAPHNLAELSMGTSQDYVEAVEAGATIVRLGTAIFGRRI